MDITDKVIAKSYEGKLQTVKDFRTEKDITVQAVFYACKNDLIDFIQVGRTKLIILTDKTLAYTPNKNRNRVKRSLMTF